MHAAVVARRGREFLEGAMDGMRKAMESHLKGVFKKKKARPAVNPLQQLGHGCTRTCPHLRRDCPARAAAPVHGRQAVAGDRSADGGWCGGSRLLGAQVAVREKGEEGEATPRGGGRDDADGSQAVSSDLSIKRAPRKSHPPRRPSRLLLCMHAGTLGQGAWRGGWVGWGARPCGRTGG